MSKEKTPFNDVMSALKKIQKLADSETRRTYKRMVKSLNKSSEYDAGLNAGSYEQASAMQFSINRIISEM
jgi:hypothetical protein